MWLRLSLFGWVWITVLGVTLVLMLLCMFFDTSEGPLGEFFEFLMFDLPNHCLRALACCLGKSAAAKIEYAFDSSLTWLCYRRNPVLQTLYLAVILGAYGLAVLFAYPRCPALLLPGWHRYSAAVCVVVCLYLWWLACTKSPGIITRKTLARFSNYDYDNVLYKEGRTCRTTGLPKLPRSKFCRFMNANVARYDHFCPWLNQAVGQENYRWFLLFLCAHTLLLAYGAYCVGMILLSYVYEKDLFDAHFYSPREKRVVKASWRVIMQFVMFNNWALFGVFLLCSVMAFVLAAFTGYHIWLAAHNMTTNESYKWADVKRYHRKRAQRRQAEAEAEAEDTSQAPLKPKHSNDANDSKGSNGSNKSDGSKADSPAADGAAAGATGAAAEGSETDAPSQPETPPASEADDDYNYNYLPEVLPGHMYSRGTLRNLLEAVWPLSVRPQPQPTDVAAAAAAGGAAKPKKRKTKGKKQH